jgi:7,8-dihydropterin-6-yl-methyl-4-(beta-D-ribofuranosyl)aminobenzene 5'-phosphate synthase
VDRVEILFLIDNYVDSLLPDQECVARPPTADEEGRMKTPLLAEHGLSVLVRTFEGNTSHTVLMDGGVSVKGLLHNVDCLGVDLSSVEAVFLSHGHYDHRAALAELVARTGKQDLPLHLHPDAFLKRRLVTPDGKHRIQPPFPEEPLVEAGARLEREKAPKPWREVPWL